MVIMIIAMITLIVIVVMIAKDQKTQGSCAPGSAPFTVSSRRMLAQASELSEARTASFLLSQ